MAAYPSPFTPSANAFSAQIGQYADPLVRYVASLPYEQKERLKASIVKFFTRREQKEQAAKARKKSGGPLGSLFGTGGGAVVGGIVGGPVGAAVGAGIGSSAGGAVGEMIEPGGANAPDQTYAMNAIRGLAPMAGLAMGSIGGEGTYGSRFQGGMRDLTQYLGENPLMGGAAGIDTSDIDFLPGATPTVPTNPYNPYRQTAGYLSQPANLRF